MPNFSAQWCKLATEGLAEAMESYALELFEKNRAVQKHHETQLEVASDDLAFIVINANDDHRSHTFEWDCW